MQRGKLHRNLGSLCVLGGSLYLIAQIGLMSQQGPPTPSNRFAGPTSSQTLALDANGTLLAVANPDNNTVTFFDVASDRNRRLREVQVGKEPWGVALNPQGTRAYVANTVSGTVSVLSVNRNSPNVARVVRDITVGTEPYALCLTPNATKLYVLNRNSNNMTVIDTRSERVVNVVSDVGFAPRACAISNDGDDADDDETMLITQFFAVPRAGQLDGEDDAKEGLVTILRTVNDAVETTVKLLPIGDTGFKAAGDAISRVAPPATVTPESLRITTGAYPNQLTGVVIKGNYAYVPSTGASPNGPVRFDVNTQSLLTPIDLTRQQDIGETINMHVAVHEQQATPKRFLTMPTSAAAKHREDEIWVVATSSDFAVKVRVDRGTGKPTVVSTGSPSRVAGVATGKNPRGIVINAQDTRAYVMNYITRNVTVINLANDTVAATLESAAMPVPGSTDDLIHTGKDLYHSSIGEFDGPSPLSPKIFGRMSNNGWGSCASCHPDGLTDNVVWIFGAGPRRTIPQHVDYDPDDPTVQRAFNWSGIFDEQEDFEANIRGTSGGLGLIVGDDGVTPAQPLAAFNPANANRRQLRSRGHNSWDAIKAYIQFGVRAPISPVSKDEPDVIEGEELFRQANCQSCHGTSMWTTSRVRFTPPPPDSAITAGQISGELRRVGTFDASLKTEVRQNAAAPLGNDGYVPPSLLSLFAWPKTFFHNGSADSLEAVMNNVTHRTAGTQGRDTLIDETSRRKLIRFILSIDGSTPPIEPSR
ncbi:MAG: beta-propeller fold lactonase family protein [Bryobacterales bacterium]|nr:beta-propeller fold lactonase family protein [Bryobacterales bacterium]